MRPRSAIDRSLWARIASIPDEPARTPVAWWTRPQNPRPIRVGDTGIEPVTPTVSTFPPDVGCDGQRLPRWLRAPRRLITLAATVACGNGVARPLHEARVRTRT